MVPLRLALERIALAGMAHTATAGISNSGPPMDA